MSLCRLCHWSFDEGLLRVSTSYEIATSPQLSALDNLPGHLTSLEGRSIVCPVEKIYWPANSLRWHHENIFECNNSLLLSCKQSARYWSDLTK